MHIDPHGLLYADPAAFSGGSVSGQPFVSSLPYPRNYNDPLPPTYLPPEPPPGASCMEKCDYFKDVCTVTAGGSGVGVTRVVATVVGLVVRPASIPLKVITGGIPGGVTAQNLMVQCMKAFNICKAACNVCL